MYTQVLLLSGCLSVCLSQSFLFRDRATALVTRGEQAHLGGSHSHHAITSADGTSVVHRHHTQATNDGRVRLFQSQPQFINSPAILQDPGLQFGGLDNSAAVFQSARFGDSAASSASAPALLQHADGRFFALNANLQPGQLFQTADGRVFTLATADDDSAAVTRAAETEQAATAAAEEEEAAAVAQTTAEEEDAAVIARDAAPTAAPAAAPAAAARTTAAPLFRGASIIATAPLTPSTAQFVAAPGFNTFRSFNGPSFSQVASPAFTQVAAPAFTQVAAPAFTRVAAPAFHFAAPVQGRGNHLLADSNTNVFQGYYSFPNAGIDFNF